MDNVQCGHAVDSLRVKSHRFKWNSKLFVIRAGYRFQSLIYDGNSVGRHSQFFRPSVFMSRLTTAFDFICSEGGEGGADTSSVRQEEIDRISRKLATLEMKVMASLPRVFYSSVVEHLD